ncbi:phage tail family protein [Lysinibacillus sp. A4]|uniref:phage tail family protein n=1 Tax=unclassified Lysinibacillus TaxID=2636778 RepID=UPI001EDC4012|nr:MULTISPECIES: phage tail family protein [unclassified Lysinibacillus]MCS5500870.1 phage tail family protein [Lysinibacillus sp. A4]UKJ44285.1 phage tail family protein [Lysinibacillus sp. ACHW1.5]
METVTYTNRFGESVTFGGPPFYLQNIEGLGDVSANLQTQKVPYEDGSTLIDVLLDERSIDITFLIVNAIDEGGYETVSRRRTEVARIVNPKLGPGTLRYENDYLVREILVVASSVPAFPDGDGRAKTLQKSMINFVAPDPYWRSLKIDEEPAFQPLFQFPFSGPFQMGMQRDRRIINNDGDVAAPLYIEFFGPADNPKIENVTTGEFIKVNQTLAEGEKMVIDTTPGTKSVEFVDEGGSRRDVINWLDLDSVFFKLQLGENDISYTADNDVQGSIVNISYHKRYNAV